MGRSGGSDRRVVITGLGVISPIGCTTTAVWDAIERRQSGVGMLESLPADALSVKYAAEVRDFTGAIGDFGPLEGAQKKAVRKGLKVMCRETQMGVAAALLALNDAGIEPGNHPPERAGVVFGSDYMLSLPQELASGMRLCSTEDRQFLFDRWGSEGMHEMNPLWLLKYLPNMPACHVAIYHDLRGPSNSITQREASANLAVAEAASTIARGHADLMVAGATGTRVHPMKTLHAVQQEEVVANGFADPTQASRPFDRDRQGMVLGEGGAAVVLEELRSAEARGATILAEVVGSGASSVVSLHNRVAHRDEALVNAMRSALRQAGIDPADVGHLHAHGASTRNGDVDEARAINKVFGDRDKPVPVTASKSFFGNLGAGGGLVELIISVLALQHDRLPPVLNYETPDPECPIPAIARGDEPAGDCFLNLSVTPQGQAGCVLIRRID